MINWFIETFPDYHMMMKECSYMYKNTNSNQHHLEGDIWSFSSNSYEQGIINNVPRHILWALLLHETGRVITRVENHRRKNINFGDFEGASCFIALEVLQKAKLPIQEIVCILKIISHHYIIIEHLHKGKPNISKLIEKFKYEEELLKDLSIFIQCNFEARTVGEKLKKRYDINNVLNLISNLSNLKQSQKLPSHKKNDLYILVGPPCSQKTTWTKDREKSFIIFSKDNYLMQIGKKFSYFTHDKIDEFLRKNPIHSQELENIYMQETKRIKTIDNKNIIIDNMNLEARKRVEWIKAFKHTHIITIVLFMSSYKSLVLCDQQR